MERRDPYIISHTVWIVFYSGPFSIEPHVTFIVPSALMSFFPFTVSSGLLTSQSPLFLYIKIKFCINAGGDEEREEEDKEVAA